MSNINCANLLPGEKRNKGNGHKGSSGSRRVTQHHQRSKGHQFSHHHGQDDHDHYHFGLHDHFGHHGHVFEPSMAVEVWSVGSWCWSRKYPQGFHLITTTMMMMMRRMMRKYLGMMKSSSGVKIQKLNFRGVNVVEGGLAS